MSYRDSPDGMVWLQEASSEEEQETYTSRFLKNLNFLTRLYPQIEADFIHDTLVDCSNVLEEATSKLKAKISSNRAASKREGESKSLAGVWLKQPDKIVDIEGGTRANQNRPRRRLLSSSSSDEDLQVLPSNTASTSRNTVGKTAPKRAHADDRMEYDSDSTSDSEDYIPIPSKQRKIIRKRVYFPKSDSDCEESVEEVLSSDESKDSLKENLSPPENQPEEEEDDNEVNDEEEEDYDDIVDSGSSDDEEDVTKVSPGKLTLRSKVLSFFESASLSDILTIPSVSQKKAQTIMELRPFENWMDLVVKIKCDRVLSIDVIDNCKELVKSREAVTKLMDECENISGKLRTTLEKLEPLDQPKILNRKMQLTHYQLLGLNWLVIVHQNRINGILADEMGLGKTIQVIAFLSYLLENHNVRGPHLIIVPSSTLDNWLREFKTWCRSFHVVKYHGSQNERAHLRHTLRAKRPDIMITTYNLLSSQDDRKFLGRMSFEYVVFDEAHMLKNMRTARFKNLIGLRSKRRLLLTGTPVQNNLLELMSLLFFTMPKFFSSKLSYISLLFQTKGEKGQSSYEQERVVQARKILQPFILRRLKADVLKQLPAKREDIKMCEMTEGQQKIYCNLIESFTKQVKADESTSEDGKSKESTTITKRKGTAMLMQLRKAANHPLLIRTLYTEDMLRKMAKAIKKDPSHRDADEQRVFEDMEVLNDYELHRLCDMYAPLKPWLLDRDRIFDSGKFAALDKMLPEIKRNGKRVLIFSQFVIMLDVLEAYLTLRGHDYLRLDGSTKVSDRIDLIDRFTQESVFAFLLSTKAGGLGINLTSANVVIIHDIDFNPYNDKQAEDRCHRVGQEKNVEVFRFISEGSVEEGMLRIGDDKLKLGEDLYFKPNDIQRSDSKDVKTLLRKALGL